MARILDPHELVFENLTDIVPVLSSSADHRISRSELANPSLVRNATSPVSLIDSMFSPRFLMVSRNASHPDFKSEPVVRA